MAYRPLLRVEGAEAMRRLSRDLRKHEDGKEIRQRTVRELKDVADEVVRAERAAVRALPSKGQNARRGRRSLRDRVAMATVSQVRTAAKDPRVSVLINTKRLPVGMRSLPAYMNAERGYERWRKPTFGHDPWRTQRATPWFERTARPYEERAQRRLLGVIDRVADEIETGG